MLFKKTALLLSLAFEFVSETALCACDYRVDTTADVYNDNYCKSGQPCSLRMATLKARNCTDSDTSTIYVPAGVYKLTAQGQENYNGASMSVNDLDLVANYLSSRMIKISGAGDSTVIDGGGWTRVLQVRGNVVIENLKIMNGKSQSDDSDDQYGAGLSVMPNAVAVINNVTFQNNQMVAAAKNPALACGGAIHNLGAIYVAGSRFISNTATEAGGAVCNLGYANIRTSEFRGNKALQMSSGGGGGVYSSAGHKIYLRDTLFFQNSGYRGGAVFLDGVSSAAASQSIILNSTFTSNNAALSGGAVSSNEAIVAIDDSTFSSNIAKGIGGAIYFDRVANIQLSQNINRSAFSYNSAGMGGAIANRLTNLVVTRSLASNNTAVNYALSGYVGQGGAFAALGNLTVSESSILRNSAAYQGGAVFSQAPVKLFSATIASNTASIQASAIAAWNHIDMKNCSLIANYGSNPLLPQLYVGAGFNFRYSYNIFENDLAKGSVNALIHGLGNSRGYNLHNGSGFEITQNTFMTDLARTDRAVASAALEATMSDGPAIGANGMAKLVVQRPKTMSAARNSGEMYANSVDDVMAAGCARFDGAGYARPKWDYCDIGAAENISNEPATLPGQQQVTVTPVKSR